MNLNLIIIDCMSKGKGTILRSLRRLRKVRGADDCGCYLQDPQYSKLVIATEMTDDEVEDWLYARKFDYIGVCYANTYDTHSYSYLLGY